jgi:hypothetical protein
VTGMSDELKRGYGRQNMGVSAGRIWEDEALSWPLFIPPRAL